MASAGMRGAEMLYDRVPVCGKRLRLVPMERSTTPVAPSEAAALGPSVRARTAFE